MSTCITASQRDLLAVMHQLPQGLLAGISLIELCLGSEEQSNSDGEPYKGTEPDPFTGRSGQEVLPGIFHGYCLGTYRRWTGRIRLFAYVYRPDLAEREMWDLYLRLQMLATLMHEIGHHEDCTTRAARGRWLADDRKKCEIYAERMEQEWVHSHVVPYLEWTYPMELGALQDWMRKHGGVCVSLAALAGDRRMTAKGGFISVTNTAFSVAAAFERLAEQVAKGESWITTHLEFARGLHYAQALKSIDSVLVEHPTHLAALTLQAHVYLDDEQYDLAEAVASKVISLDKTVEDAWWTLSDVHEARKDWPALLFTATSSIDMRRPDHQPRPYAFVQSAKAKMELGDFAGAEADLSELEELERSRKRPSERMLRLASELRAEIGRRGSWKKGTGD